MKRLFLLTLTALVSLGMMAGEVTEQQALQKAREFMKGKQLTKSAARRAGQKAGEWQAFYVFNAQDNGGFVIVSADDRATEILGYSDEGYLDLNDMPDNLRWWLQGYEQEIKSIPATATKTAVRRAAATRDQVPALLKTLWSQGEPYNLMCPDGSYVDYYEDGYNSSNRCLTGCVATAMAQIMYYHKWPKNCPAIDSYVMENDEEIKGLPATTFKWDDMITTYSGGYTSAQGTAIAELMRYCGQSVSMDYGTGGSGSDPFDAALSFSDTFGYSAAAHQVYRADYPATAWEDILYQELQAGRPILYSGNSKYDTSAGHTFVCDGYKNGMFHFNLGWGGKDNGYYVISAYSEIEYNGSQSAVIGIEKSGTAESKEVRAFDVLANKLEYTRSSVSASFSMTVYGGFMSLVESFTGKVGFGLYQGGTMLKVLAQTSINDLPGESFYPSLDFYVSVNSVENGEYAIRPIYQPNGSGSWKLCAGNCMLAATVAGLKMTIKELGAQDGTGLIVNSAEIAGSKKAEKPTKIKFNITNNGGSYSQATGLYVNNALQDLSEIAVVPGTTSDVYYDMTAPSTGNIPIRLVCFDEDYNETEIWSGTMTFFGPQEYSLTATRTGVKYKDGMMTVHLNVANDKDYAYDEGFLYQVRRSAGGGSYTYNGTSTSTTIIPASGQRILSITDDVIAAGQECWLVVFYYSNGSQKNLYNGFFTPEVTVDGDANGDKKTDLKDAASVASYIIDNSSADINTAVADMNEDGQVTVTDAVILTNTIAE